MTGRELLPASQPGCLQSSSDSVGISLSTLPCPLLSQCRVPGAVAAAGQVRVVAATASCRGAALWLQLLIYKIDNVFIDGWVEDAQETDKVKLGAHYLVALGRFFNFFQLCFIICKMGLRVRR